MKLRNALWIWGQNAGTHHNTAGGNIWNLPGENHMEPDEGCRYLGIPNCCRVVMGGLPRPPFDRDADALDFLDQVVWSIVGDSGSTCNNDDTDLDEVLRIAALHPNVTGAILDDFMNEERMRLFPPEKLAVLREALHAQNLKFWTVLYTHELKESSRNHLAQMDVVSLWTWHGSDLPKLSENFDKARALLPEGTPLYAGCYMWDYGKSCPMDPEMMTLQLETYRRWLHEGKIHGVIFCSNTIADLGIDAVEQTRLWIAEHGDEEI